MLNFSLNEEIKEQAGGKLYPVEIVSGNYIKSVEFVDQYESIDITFYNPENGYEFRDRIFKPDENPQFGTAEEALLKVQRKLKHILNRFMSNEESSFNAISWKDLALKFCTKLTEKSKDVPFDLKLIWNKDFTFPAIGLVPFMKVETDERPLTYSKWEKENRLIQKTITSNDGIAESPGVATDEEIF